MTTIQKVVRTYPDIFLANGKTYDDLSKLLNEGCVVVMVTPISYGNDDHKHVKVNEYIVEKEISDNK